MSNDSSLPRRSFLRGAASCVALSTFSSDFPAVFSQELQDVAKSFDEIRTNLLQLVNEERAVEKVSALALDEFATRVATKHAIDMATGKFANHWGRDGLKPYQRYSFAGGIDATQENISAADNMWSERSKDLIQDTAYLHVRLYQEKFPNDGHRKTILAPQHTHVGFGLAVDQLRLRVVELFVARYVKLAPVERKAKPGDTFTLTGKLLNPNHVLHQVEVCYEPLPISPELSWLSVPRPYSLPDVSVLMFPKLPDRVTYANGTRGEVEVGNDGRFRVPVTMFKTASGIYTILCWVKRTRSEKAFPATEVCIRVE